MILIINLKWFTIPFLSIWIINLIFLPIEINGKFYFTQNLLKNLHTILIVQKPIFSNKNIKMKLISF